MKKEEGHYTLKFVDKLPKKGNANLLYVINSSPIEQYFKWTLKGVYEIFEVGTQSTSSASLWEVGTGTQSLKSINTPENIASGNSSVAAGNENTASSFASVSLGNFNRSTGYASFTAGNNNDASGFTSISLGNSNDSSGYASFTTGNNNEASGYASSAFGNSNTASESYATAFGSNNNSSGQNSAAFGNSNSISGQNSFGTGSNNNATSQDCFVTGNFNTTSNFYTSAFGNNNTASGQGATVFGNFNTSSGQNSAAFGAFNNVSGQNSLVSGQNNNVSGQKSISNGQSNSITADNCSTFGSGNTASGNNSFCSGSSNQSTATNTFTAGNNNQATGENSAAFGSNSNSPSFSEFSIGVNPTDYTPVSTSLFEGSDKIFNVGNGVDSTNKSDALTILKNGDIGVGINNFESNTTGEKLQVEGLIRSNVTLAELDSADLKTVLNKEWFLANIPSGLPSNYYEEGTWTPNVNVGTSVVIPTNINARYIRNGNSVNFTFEIGDFSTDGLSGLISIDLPFPAYDSIGGKVAGGVTHFFSGSGGNSNPFGGDRLGLDLTTSLFFISDFESTRVDNIDVTFDGSDSLINVSGSYITNVYTP